MTEKDNSGDDAPSRSGVADVPNTKYVTHWVIGAASNRSSREANFPVISKKMRDDPTHGYRRSGLWTTIKVLLQLGLTVALNSPSNGKYLYKLIILKFMSTMGSDLGEYSDATMNVDTFDTVVEILAKIARRVDKLTKLCFNPPPSIIELAVDQKDKSIECISKIRHILDAHHSKMLRLENTSTQLSTVGQLKFDEHIDHNLSELTKYLDEIKSFHVQKSEKIEEDNIVQEHVFFDPSIAPDIGTMKSLTTDNELMRFLNDVEDWVLSRLDETRMAPNLEYLRALAKRYSATAHNFYKNDPIGYSRMVLTMLKIIQVSNGPI